MKLQNVLIFLENLKENNYKEWFDANRSSYEDARHSFLEFTSNLIEGLSEMDPALAGLKPKDCVFRIFRDVRFSNDKSPYKTNFGAFFSKGGRKRPFAGYYVHLEPGGSFAGGGIYMPPGDVLNLVRKEIYYNPEKFKSILYSDEFRQEFGDMFDHKLQRPPQGFDKNFADMELLKYKSYAVGRNVDDNIAGGEDYAAHVLNSYRVMKPLVDFLNQALNQ